MTSSEIIELIQFTSHILYLFISFMSGIVLGYIVGFRDGGDF